MRVQFILIPEGQLDEALIPHLQNLCVEAGADEAFGVAPDLARLREQVGHAVADKLRAAMTYEPQANLILLHRDADSRDPEPRHQELAQAVAACGLSKQWAAVVPVQETEAWLLLDDAAIRRVAGRPNGRVDLALPSPQTVESVSRPTERLEAALITASGVTGRRLDRFMRRELGSCCRRLLLQLPTSGPIEGVPARARMRAAIREAVPRLSDAELGSPADREHPVMGSGPAGSRPRGGTGEPRRSWTSSPACPSPRECPKPERLS